ncbi:MAG: T9SS type A sorting domain-containing protein [Cyclobacteriaceae bacterium]
MRSIFNILVLMLLVLSVQAQQRIPGTSESTPTDFCFEKSGDNAFDGSLTDYASYLTNDKVASMKFDQIEDVIGVRYYPRPGFEDRIDGADFQLSSDGVSWTTVATISGAPTGNDWTEVVFGGAVSAEYGRISHPNKLLTVAEVEFLRSGSSGGLADLIVTDISWTPVNPQLGEEVTFFADIANTGGTDVPGNLRPNVVFKIDGLNVSWRQLYQTVIPANGTLEDVDAASGPSGKTTWTAQEGTFTVSVVVDGNQVVPESDDANNTFQEDIEVSSTLLLEAEHADISGDSALITLSGASNDSVAQLKTTPSSITWTIPNNVSATGTYDATFATRSRGGNVNNGDRKATISTGAGSSEVIHFAPSATVYDTIVSLTLNAGTNNTITLVNEWGHIEIDYLSIDLAGCSTCRTATSSAIDQDKEIDKNIVVYPNPSNGIVKLQGVTGKVEVYDVMGKKILETIAVEGQITSFDLSGKPGMYIVKTISSRFKIIID